MTDLPKQTLVLTIWDKDYGKSNDYLGEFEISPVASTLPVGNVTSMFDVTRLLCKLTTADVLITVFSGGLELGWKSKGERLKHWIDVIKFPDHKHEGWHRLGENLITD